MRRTRAVRLRRAFAASRRWEHAAGRRVEFTTLRHPDRSQVRALAVIDETLKANPRVLKDPAPVVQVSVLGGE
ncbi:MAG: hypothetical protein IT529_15635 [Burkholderiales bacterium]|nr:hypothetical protein [Burkholderiales bacterium]